MGCVKSSLVCVGTSSFTFSLFSLSEDEDYSPDVPVVCVSCDAVVHRLYHSTLTPSHPTPISATLGAEDKTWEELNEDRGAEGGATAAAAVATGTKPKHAEKEKVRSRDAAAAREREEMARAAVEAGVPLTDPAAERKRLEALQLKADMAAARDSLGVGSAAGKVTLTTDPETLVAAIAVTDAEGFKQLGRLVGARVHELAGPRGGAFAMRFYAEILAVAGDKLGLDDLKALESVISAGAQECCAVSAGGPSGEFVLSHLQHRAPPVPPQHATASWRLTR